MQKVIVVLGCIIDRLPFECIWREFAQRVFVDEDGNEWSVDFRFHAKHIEKAKASSVWLAEHLLGVSYKPEWGSFEVIQAYHALVCDAVEIANVEHCIFVSESCLPVGTLSRWVKLLREDPKTWLFVRFPGRCKTLKRIAGLGIDNYIVKSDMCCQINKKHMHMLAEMTTDDEIFRMIRRGKNCVDELYVGSALKWLGELAVVQDSESYESKKDETLLLGSRAERMARKRKRKENGESMQDESNIQMKQYGSRHEGCNRLGSKIESGSVSCRTACAMFLKMFGGHSVKSHSECRSEDVKEAISQGCLTMRKYCSDVTLSQWQQAHADTSEERKDEI